MRYARIALPWLIVVCVCLGISGCFLFTPPPGPGEPNAPGGEPNRPGDPVQRGAKLYGPSMCAFCHGSEGCGDIGPNIRGVSFAELDAAVRDPSSAHLGGADPQLTDQALQDMVAYLGSLTTACPEKDLVEAGRPAEYADLSLIGIHDPVSDAYDPDCLSCHGNRTQESGVDGTTAAAHSVMKGILGSGNHRCLNCHGGGVDLLAQSHARLRDNMFSSAVATCGSAKCHGASGPVPFYMTE